MSRRTNALIFVADSAPCVLQAIGSASAQPRRSSGATMQMIERAGAVGKDGFERKQGRQLLCSPRQLSPLALRDRPIIGRGPTCI